MTETKYKHGCLTAWLVLMIVANAFTVLSYALLTLSRTVHSARPHTPVWALSLLTVACIANIVFAIALFRWRRWGFIGLLGTTVLTLAINLRLGIKPVFVTLGLCGIIILYAVLQIDGDRKGWDQLG